MRLERDPARPAGCAAGHAPDRVADIVRHQQAERDAGRRMDGPTSAGREELIRLRRENQRLRLERDILSKAAAWFARESKAKAIPVVIGALSR
ncbi:hypothetical protein GCM10017653_07780 [Ancylobacter defluvii]|uniref:Transposase n=1 Tax=Ancylobacter defluvii TaxID=1282440 RepID=A0A9W6JUU9_9HYPH|nr:hypothetical protein GCM10017653_07780 [Ancylobacter defluvii]